MKVTVLAGLCATALLTISLAGCGGSDSPSANRLAQPHRTQASGTLDSPPLPDAASLMNWAEGRYPQFFPGPAQTGQQAPYTYRFYPGSGNYLGVADEGVYVLGPLSGGAVTRVGGMRDFACSVYPQYCSALTHDYIPTLRGIQVGEHADWMNPTSSRWRNASDIVASGANAVRLMTDQFSSESEEPFPGLTLTERTEVSIARYGGLIEYLLANNIHVIVSLNVYSWSAGKSWPDDGRRLWTSLTAQEEVIDMWSQLARKYKGQPGIIFDLMNEPHGETASETANDSAATIAAWNGLYPRIVSAVTGIDPDRWMLVEPIWGQPGYLDRLVVSSNRKVMYAIHNYRPHFFTHQGTAGWPVASGSTPYPGVIQDLAHTPAQMWNKEALMAVLSPARDFAVRYNVRVVLDEVGVMRGAPAADRARYLADMIDIADSLNFGLIWFKWDGWGVPATFRDGWSYENSELQQPLHDFFVLNKDPAKR